MKRSLRRALRRLARIGERGNVSMAELLDGLKATATPVHESEDARSLAGFVRVDEHLFDPRDLASSQLPCSGCAHSAVDAPFPGMPSGERPCGFCVRNPQLLAGGVADWFGEQGPTWYGGETPPFKTPMDCYIATDRLTQQRIFDELDRLKHEGKDAPPRERYDRHPLSGEPGEAWCCDGGAAPGGHTWTCWRWLGVSFG